MVTVMCPHCHTLMAILGPGHWACITCPRIAQSGDTAAAIEQRETDRLAALDLLDAALGPRAVQAETDRQITNELEATMGQTIETRGCPSCGGTMYRTVDTDEHGNPTNVTQFICQSCGHMA